MSCVGNWNEPSREIAQARKLDSHSGDRRAQQLQREAEALALVLSAVHRASSFWS
jgi:hypothetical protein